MAQRLKTTGRKLVTLPLDTIERAERYRQRYGAPSESDAFRALIEAGLSRFDTRTDLFQRCETATAGGVSIGEIINSILADPPLVKSTSVEGQSVYVHLRPLDPDDMGEPTMRFRFSRLGQTWMREVLQGQDDWHRVREPAAERPPARPATKDLDDDIPF